MLPLRGQIRRKLNVCKLLLLLLFSHSSPKSSSSSEGSLIKSSSLYPRVSSPVRLEEENARIAQQKLDLERMRDNDPLPPLTGEETRGYNEDDLMRDPSDDDEDFGEE
jgi:hypothetical protein